MQYITLDNWLKHDIQDTSIAAYRTVKKYGLHTLYGKIISVMEFCPYGVSIGELSVSMNIQKSTISARLNELRKLGIIIFYEQRNSNESGVLNNFFILAPNYKELVVLID